MKNKIRASGKGFTLALWSVSAFAAVHIVMCLLNNTMLPTKPPWTMTSLWIEIGFAGAALLISLAALLIAWRTSSDSLNSFRSLFGTLRCAGFYLAIVWCIWSFLAFFLAMREGWGGFYHNARYLFYLTASLVVLFPLGYYLGREDRTALLHFIYDLCLLCLFAFLVYGFYRFFKGRVTFRAFYNRKYNFKRSRVRFGMNPNTVGSYSAFLLITGLYRMGSLKKVWKKALLLIGLVPITAAFIMTESRSAIYGSAAAVGFLCGAAVFRRCKKKGIAAVLLSLAVFAATAVMFIGAFYGLRKLLNSMQKQVIYYYRQITFTRTENTREPVGENAAQITSRTSIWSAVLSCIFKDRHLLLHGCTQSSTTSTVLLLLGKKYNTHNQIIEVLLAYGLPSAILFLLWLFWAAGKSLFLSLSPSEKGNSRWMLPASLLMLIVNNMAETMLVGRGHFEGGFFFLIAGYVAGMAPRMKLKDDPKE